MAKINFKIVTPERVIYSSAIEEVTIPTTSGEISVLPNHTPLVSLLKSGEMILKKDGKKIHLAVSGGFVEVRPKSTVIIMADTAEHAEEIDIARAEAAKQRALDMLKEKEKLSDVQFVKLQGVLEKEIARLKVGKRYRKLSK